MINKTIPTAAMVVIHGSKVLLVREDEKSEHLNVKEAVSDAVKYLSN